MKLYELSFAFKPEKTRFTSINYKIDLGERTISERTFRDIDSFKDILDAELRRIRLLSLRTSSGTVAPEVFAQNYTYFSIMDLAVAYISHQLHHTNFENPHRIEIDHYDRDSQRLIRVYRKICDISTLSFTPEARQTREQLESLISHFEHKGPRPSGLPLLPPASI